jgi:hypothetical protein
MQINLKHRIERLSIPEPNTGCWLWLGAITTTGYGFMTLRNGKRRSVMAHRVSYEAFVGPIPDGYEIDHKCRQHECVNPDHLEPVTHAENMRRYSKFDPRIQSADCKHGHPLDGVRTRNSGGRYCKTCNLLNKQTQRRRIAA